MRDVIVTLLVFGSLPFVFKRPWLGAVLWIWISVMNPHSQGYGFARTMPFAAIIAATAFASWVISNAKYKLQPSPVTAVFLVFLAWMSVTSLGAIHPDQVGDQWIKVYKIFGMNLLVMMLMQNRKHIEAAVWSMVVSVGVYGVKGGLFTIRSGGSERVWGPSGTFIEGNNELALALVFIIPLMFYLLTLLTKRWQRYAMFASVFLCALASLGSYSRGAALALGAMAGFLWLKSEKKATMGLAMLVSVPVLLLIMPGKWFERIDTINTYQEDASSMGRINAWKMAWNLASDRFLGGGFEIYDYGVFLQYAPVPEDVHAAHSIYFQVLGEHGFVGLALYLLLGVLTFRTGSWIIKHAKDHEEMKWASSLAKMSQVSLLGFAVGGAFLSLVYFDVPYYLMGVLVATRAVMERELKAKGEAAKLEAAEKKKEAQALAAAQLAGGGHATS
jgi:putative inorganic carbon (HCO3(-)) transporter